jgi:hypothetical protein
MSELKRPYAFTDPEQYSLSDLASVIREGELEVATSTIPRQRAVTDFMVKCAVFEYWARQKQDV